MGLEVRDVSSWPVVADETAGADAKDWLTPPELVSSESRGSWWLFKEVKFGTVTAKGGVVTGKYRRNDDRVEVIASELAIRMGLPAAQVELAIRDGVEGCISRYVIPDGWAMYSGDTLLSEFEGYVPCAGNRKLRDRVGHNLGNIQTLLEGCKGPTGATEDWPAFDVFAGYLVFDALIANTDRHAVNWGVLFKDSQRRLAPSFDHGSGLGSGQTPDGMRGALEAIPAWCGKGRATRFEGGRSVSLVDLALTAVSMASPRAAGWLASVEALSRDEWREIVRAVPGLSVDACTFIDMVLTENRRRLCQ